MSQVRTWEIEGSKPGSLSVILGKSAICYTEFTRQKSR
jgi:hypothetical protein